MAGRLLLRCDGVLAEQWCPLDPEPPYRPPLKWTAPHVVHRYAAAGHGNLFHQDFQVCNHYAGGLEAAARVRCASLMIVGAHDQMTPPKASATLAQALHAKVLQLPAGHSLMGEVPDAVLNAIQAFISEEAP
jgi:pimeloyl-ACP methyl ester carboxylesterase